MPRPVTAEKARRAPRELATTFGEGVATAFVLLFIVLKNVGLGDHWVLSKEDEKDLVRAHDKLAKTAKRGKTKRLTKQIAQIAPTLSYIALMFAIFGPRTRQTVLLLRAKRRQSLTGVGGGDDA